MAFWFFYTFTAPNPPTSLLMPHKADRAADIHRENMKKKRREMEQASLDATSDLLDTDSNATFAMVSYDDLWLMFLGSLNATKKCSVKVHFDR